MTPVPPTTPQPPPPAVPAASGPQNAESPSITEHREAVRNGDAGTSSSVSGRRRYSSRAAGGEADGQLVLQRDELEGLTAEELHDLAAALEIPGRSQMNKGELIDALTAQD